MQIVDIGIIHINVSLPTSKYFNYIQYDSNLCTGKYSRDRKILMHGTQMTITKITLMYFLVENI